ncbi:hypothetical protein NKG94_20530 [Micromonospora sp. M12]
MRRGDLRHLLLRAGPRRVRRGGRALRHDRRGGGLRLDVGGRRAGDLSVEHIRRAVEINVLGITYLLREAVQHLDRQGHGNVVYIGALALAAPGPASPSTEPPRATATAWWTRSPRPSTATGSGDAAAPGPMPTRLQERVGAEFLDEVYAMPEQVATEVVRLLLLKPDDLYVSGERVLRADGRW